MCLMLAFLFVLTDQTLFEETGMTAVSPPKKKRKRHLGHLNNGKGIKSRQPSGRVKWTRKKKGNYLGNC